MTPPRPERLPLADEPPSPELRRRVDEALAAGALVAAPTETVYGVAARADSAAAVQALRALKGLSAERPLTWHVGTSAVLEQFPDLPGITRRLAERYWPGPLTLVLAGVPKGLELAASDGWTGVRLPAHLGTAGLLEHLEYPVVMSSANRAGQPPAVDAEAVLEELGAELELVLDGGPARLGEASGVLAVGPGRFELLREGLLSISTLRRTAGLRIGFACTGNTCRSPMAEGLARRALARRLGLGTEPADAKRIAEFGYSVGSMGVATSPGFPASEHAVAAMRRRGIDIARHASRLATTSEVGGYDRLYCLTRGHLEALRMMLPPGRGTRPELLDPDGGDVPDPIGGPPEVYERCAEHIEGLIAKRLKEWV